MTRKDLTDVTVVLDRSGSMDACREDAEGGLNTFIKEQKEAKEGECLFTLVQFDTEYEFVHKGVPIKDVPEFHLEPRGWTALLDAVGRAINETGDRLSKMSEEDRPGLVCFVIITDGLENSSKEFTRDQIKEMIQKQTSEYKWQFTFLGANQDAFHEAGNLGISAAAAANYTGKKTSQAFKGASSNVKRMRTAAALGMSVNCSYTDDERKAMTEED